MGLVNLSQIVSKFTPLGRRKTQLSSDQAIVKGLAIGKQEIKLVPCITLQGISIGSLVAHILPAAFYLITFPLSLVQPLPEPRSSIMADKNVVIIGLVNHNTTFVQYPRI